MRIRLLLSALLLPALVLAGCGSKPAEVPNPGTNPSGAQSEKTPVVASDGTKYLVDASRSTAAYHVRETFLGNQLNVTAVGTTSDFTGEIILEEGVIKPSTVQVNLSTLKSDEERRDRQVRSALDTSTHPLATLVITGAEGAPTLQDGQELPIKLQGNMTIKGTERRVVWDAVAKLSGETLTMTAEITFKMTDFGIKPPSIAGFVSVVDEVTLKIDYVGTKE